jgi:isoleucyl-tRNA synthetase
MKQISGAISHMSQEEISRFEKEGTYTLSLESQTIELNLEDVEIVSEDIPGWLVTNEGNITVALDITITDELRYEGVARELINRIQNIRKESGFDVTDKIEVRIEKHDAIEDAVKKHNEYIGSQILANSIHVTDNLENNNSRKVEIDDDVQVRISVSRVEG